MPRGRLLGAAAVGGAAYMVGKRRGGRAQAGDDQDQEPVDDDQQQAEASADQSAPYSDDSLDQPQKLGDMHNSGILTDEEFDAAKGKILAGS